MKICGTIFAFIIFLCVRANAQNVYFFTDGPPYPAGFWKLDVNTCTICPVFSPNISSQSNDWGNGSLLLPDGNILILRTVGIPGSPPGGLLRFDPPNTTPINYIPGPTFSGGCVAPDGTVYLSAELGLYTFNPVNNTISLVGNYPAGQQSMENIYFQNGQLYGFCCSNGVTQSIVQINISNPAASTVVGSTWSGFFDVTTASDGVLYGYNSFVSGLPYGFYAIAVPGGTTTPTCVPPVPPPYVFGLGSVRSMMSAPPGAPDLPCLCLAENSTPVQSQMDVCVPSNVTVSFSSNGSPDFNDVVRYILYTNPANPMGSILQTNTTPVFTYTSPIQPNTPYYVAQIIGNPLNGNIDPADPCLAISEATTVIWRPKPTIVSLTTTTGNICGNDCGTVELTISGTPPFAYSWQLQQGGNVLTPLQVVFNSLVNPATIQACPPVGTTGPAEVVICGLLDAYCPNP